MQFSPDGKRLAIGGLDRKILLRNVATQEQVASYKGGGGARRIFFSPDGRLLISELNRRIRVWETDTERQTGTFKLRDYVTSTALSPDGRTLALTTNSAKKIRLWDVVTQRERDSLDPGDRYISVGTNLAFSPDGRFLAFAKGSGICMWDMASRHELGTYGGVGYPKIVAFSPDGILLAYLSSSEKRGFSEPVTSSFNPITLKAYEQKLGLLDHITGQVVIEAPIPVSDRQFGESLTFSPDGTLIAIILFGGHIQLWGIV